MLDFYLNWRLLGVLVLGLIVAASYCFFGRYERAHRIAMAVCACLGVWTFTLFGAMHDHGPLGHQNLHAHDFYHYYFGSKYLKEWGYHGMYVATVAALEEIGHEEPAKAIRFDRIRDLREGSHFLYRDEFLPLEDAQRARFTSARWSELKRDLSFLRTKTMDNNWWHDVLLDAGFNPPPSYAVLCGAVSNRVPFDEATWKYLGYIDFALIAIGIAMLAYAIGPVPAMFALVVLGNAPVTTYNWTGGSFMRQIWLFFLILGVAALARRRWTLAGVGLGAATAVVVFPGCFLAGALTPLGYRALRTGSRRPVVRTAVGAFAAIAVLVGASVVAYGMTPWGEWRSRIGAHDVTFFTNHLGIQKILTFSPEVASQAFGAGDSVFPEWNAALVARQHWGRGLDLDLVVLLSLWVVAGGLRARPAEASLVVGSGLLVLWMMPASYYTIYVGVFAAVMLANRKTRLGRERLAVIAVALVVATVMPHYAHDLIVQSLLLSAGWIVCILTLSTLTLLDRPVFDLSRSVVQKAVIALGAASAVLLAIAVGVRNRLHDAAFLPPSLVGPDRVVDRLDFGNAGQEAAHSVAIAEGIRVPRSLLDTYGYRVRDEGGILRKSGTLRYDLAPAPKGGRIVVRTDSFYKGELLTTVNGRSAPAVHLEPRQSLFAYLTIPLPTDLGDQTLRVQQATTASDVGVFSVFLLEP